MININLASLQIYTLKNHFFQIYQANDISSVNFLKD